ncbi:undecaprenyl-phosphate glucose phosphotransferase [Thalassotalea litorea]|uniref:undecaprenyl-phosphate glucose phosphotransferase n=1 Tax=Thalassotalea litorea TaxID=2020715 RepID=UPI003734DAE0
MGKTKATKPLVSRNACWFQLIDLFIIGSTLPLVATLYGVTFSNEYLICTLVAVIIFSYLSASFDIYQPRHFAQKNPYIICALVVWTMTAVLLLMFAFGFKQTQFYSRVTITLWFCVTLVGIGAWRILWGHWQTKIRQTTQPLQIAIVGFNTTGMDLLREIESEIEGAYKFLGFFEQSTEQKTEKIPDDFNVRNISELYQLCQTNQVNQIFVALPMVASPVMNQLLVKLANTHADVHLVPDTSLLSLNHTLFNPVGDVDTYSLFQSPHRGVNSLTKRFEDIFIGSILLVIFMLPMLIIALLVKIDSVGPTVFKQRRYGLNGEEIYIYKFRTMYDGEQYKNVKQALRNDPRVTPVGNFLRKFSLDELPQLINVLIGTMSIVGPRPHAINQNEFYRQKINYYMLRHKVKPGITGWAQVNGWRGETDKIWKMEKRIEFDLHYIRNWSILLDLKILALTIMHGFYHKNAY